MMRIAFVIRLQKFDIIYYFWGLSQFALYNSDVDII